MRKFKTFLMMGSLLFLVSQQSWAARAFITDSFKVTLRTGPGIEHRIITMVSSGDAVEVVEAGLEWTRIRLVNSDGEQKEGWVLSRYLMERHPWEGQAKRLLEENATLSEKLTSAEGKIEESFQREGELQRKLQQTSATLEQVQADFDTLRRESSEFVKLKEQFEAAKSTLETEQEHLKKLAKENASLRSSHNVRWFLAGALVFVSALLIGLVIGRREKKRRSGLSGWNR